MTDEAQDLRDGLIAGVLAGLAVAAYFLLVDSLQAQPLRTPRFLAGALFNGGEGEAGLLLVSAFTAVHLAVFAVIGGTAHLLFRLTDLPLNPLTGGVYGLFVCTVLFYGSLVTTGTAVLAAPSWPAVLVGNLLGGVALGTYLHWTGPEPGVTGLARHLEEHRVLREGLVSGLLGAAVVALWFLVLDGFVRQPLFTPGALGSLLFHGAASPEQVRVTTATIWGYTVVHVAAFLLFGMVVSALVAQADRVPSFIFAVVLLGVVFELFFVGLVASLGTWVLEEFAWWSILGGNLLAALTMGWYLWRRHPDLRRTVLEGGVWADEAGAPGAGPAEPGKARQGPAAGAEASRTGSESTGEELQ